MRLEPTLALQSAIVTRLLESADVQEHAPPRQGEDFLAAVFDRVPKGSDNKPRQPPYVRVGNLDSDVPNKGESYDGSEVFLQIDAFGNREYVGKGGVKRLAGAVVEALDECEDQIDIEDYRLLVLQKWRVEFRTEPDGLTERAIITFRAKIEPRV